ncbi:hypothetical protein H5410_037532 [Solanum commersonii]|uniref:Uncharacterized protein n=1 Tax=Solanum commersonii TaxID=4109 RepID=A0A9J5YAG8_SOLCO|nr:hypothetical protein H5410_037532 [Solanum commersonii]
MRRQTYGTYDWVTMVKRISYHNRIQNIQLLKEKLELVPDSDVFKDVLDSSHIQLSLHGAEGEANEDNVDEVVTQNSWQIDTFALAIRMINLEADWDSLAASLCSPSNTRIMFLKIHWKLNTWGLT